jgi:hypothetical protein
MTSYRLVLKMFPGMLKFGVFTRKPRYSARISQLGLNSYATPPPNRAPMFVFRFASRFVVHESFRGEKIIAPGPASTNGLNLLKFRLKTYAPLNSICSV